MIQKTGKTKQNIIWSLFPTHTILNTCHNTAGLMNYGTLSQDTDRHIQQHR